MLLWRGTAVWLTGELEEVRTVEPTRTYACPFAYTGGQTTTFTVAAVVTATVMSPL